MKRIKALALLSGGLDSTLAVKLILDQGIEVEALNFWTPFCLCGRSGCGAFEVAKKFSMPIKAMKLDKEYLQILRKPKYGYGKNMNPCIDCRILMLKKAKKYAQEIGASFIFTGEVLDERPMSQHLKALKIIEKEANLVDKILRPLSAKLLPPTIMENKGLVDREKLGNIRGRSRKKQIKMAAEFGIMNYPCPAGGCLLTYKEFAGKVRDLFDHKKRVTMEDVQFLKVGRHFRLGKNKLIVGKNEAENKILLRMKSKNDYYFEAENTGSPITILQGPKTRKAIEKAADLTAFYSDKKGDVSVKFGRAILDRSIISPKIEPLEVEKLRII